ncbi:hypothetical protein GGD61_008036 [Bradyrhizobium sp. SBR1B]|nr:hypothetical protein [Bradyrhizobium sp. SBR1B]MBB4398852.1 hypothetical protein [Bradyrhizobium sp. ERR14]
MVSGERQYWVGMVGLLVFVPHATIQKGGTGD